MNGVVVTIELVDSALKKLLIILMAMLLVDVSWQVLTRFILATPSSFTEELARFLLIWIGLLGSAQAYRHKMHLGVDIFVKSMSTKKAAAINKFVQLITILFSVSVLIYGGMKLVFLAYDLEQKSAAMQLNMGIVYLALPLSGILLALFAFEKLIVSPVSTSNAKGT